MGALDQIGDETDETDEIVDSISQKIDERPRSSTLVGAIL
jgi:hypothetical protein